MGARGGAGIEIGQEKSTNILGIRGVEVRSPTAPPPWPAAPGLARPYSEDDTKHYSGAAAAQYQRADRNYTNNA